MDNYTEFLENKNKEYKETLETVNYWLARVKKHKMPLLVKFDISACRMFIQNVLK